MKYLPLFEGMTCKGHERRFALTLEWLESLLSSDAIIYDAIYEDTEKTFTCPLDLVIDSLFPVDLRTTAQADLRCPLPIADAAADGVICAETIEHIQDYPTVEPCGGHDWHDSGVKKLLGEMHRILKPGGWLFLSTPNLSQYGCIWRHIQGFHSGKWCDAHVREFGFHEIDWFVRNAGFSIERIEAVNVWEDIECPEELRHVIDVLCPETPRGHATFVLARKGA